MSLRKQQVERRGERQEKINPARSPPVLQSVKPTPLSGKAGGEHHAANSDGRRPRRALKAPRGCSSPQSHFQNSVRCPVRVM